MEPVPNKVEAEGPGQSADPACALLATGAPFEITTLTIDDTPTRIFKHGPHTLADVYRAASGHGARVFCVHQGEALTYADMLRKAAALAEFLRAHKLVNRGSRIAIAMQNRPEWMIAFIAVTAAGATAVLVNSRGSGAEIAAALTVTDACAVIADTPRALLLSGLAYPHPLIVADDGDGVAPGQTAYSLAIAGWENAELKPVSMQPEDEALVMFTSGTTGGPKGALLDQRGVTTGVMNIQFSMAVVGARMAAARRGIENTIAAGGAQPSGLLAVPLFHSSGCYSIFLSNLLRGGKIVIQPKWNASQALEMIERERITAFSGSPAMLWDLLRLDRNGRDLSCLLSIGVGGQALSPQLLREIVVAFPGAILGAGYGMTETNGTVCLIAGEDLLSRPTSSGSVIYSADMKITDGDGMEVPVGTVGEICVRGAMLMRGYCKRPDESAAALRDGWLHTGDLGRMDMGGYLHVIDRIKDIVISGGENISCTEVENVAMEYSSVAEAAAFGIDDQRLGEILVLAVVVAKNATVDAQALKNYVAEHLAIYKVPRVVMPCDELPRNALGKINRNELRRRYLDWHR